MNINKPYLSNPLFFAPNISRKLFGSPRLSGFRVSGRGPINMAGFFFAPGLYIVGSKHSCNFVKAGAELLQARLSRLSLGGDWNELEHDWMIFRYISPGVLC